MFEFGGDKKFGGSILTKVERRMIDWVVPRIPRPIEGWHLTLASIPISLCIVLFSYFAKENIHWLWGVSVMIIAQYFTDSFDGSLGKFRGAGLIRWGYYMDHFLDFIFLCSILIGYSLILPDHFKWLHFFVLAIFGSFMVNSFLAFGATNKFRIAHMGIGPTEIRIIFVAINTLLIFFGKTYLAFAVPYVLIFSLFGLCFVVYQTSKEIWEMDMIAKREHGTR